MSGPLIQIQPKSPLGLFWAETCPPSNFHGKPFRSFLRNPADKQTRMETLPPLWR